MPFKLPFPIRALFRELELRFCRSIPLSTPDLLGYYLTFLLLDHPLDETWLILLDEEKRLVDSIQFTDSIFDKEEFPDVLYQQDKCAAYYCFAHTHSSGTTEPSGPDRGTHRNLVQYFSTDPEYLGTFIVNQAMDYCYLPPYSPEMQEDPYVTIVDEQMRKHTGFGIRALCAELEQRYALRYPLKTPDQAAYYAVFFLHGKNPQHTWFFFLDHKYKLCHTVQRIPKSMLQSASITYVAHYEKECPFFYIAAICKGSVPAPTEMQRNVHRVYSSYFPDASQKYMGMLLVTETMDYLFLPPYTE